MNGESIILQTLPVTRPSLRIVVVTETYPPEVNGVAMTIGRMVRALQARGHQVQLIRPRQGPDDRPSAEGTLEEVLQKGVRIPRYEGLKMGLPAKAALGRLWSVRRPDVVHIATEGPLGWSALAAATKLRIPVATDFHTNFHSYSRHYGLGWLRKPIIGYLRKFHNKSALTMVPTRGISSELSEHGYQKLVVVERGVDHHHFHPSRRSETLRASWGAASADPVVIYVGRIAPEKNLQLLIESFEAFRARQRTAKLVFVGDGPEIGALRQEKRDYVFCGARMGDDLAAHYASGDLFMFPSLTETFGNVVLEAMASGLPVLAYDYAAAAEHIRHDVNGLLAPYGDHRAFHSTAHKAGERVSDLPRLGTAARKTAEKIGWSEIEDKFERVLLHVANGGIPDVAQTESSAAAMRRT